MKNLDFIENDKLSHLYETCENNDYEYNPNNFDEEIDYTKGWSHVYLDEVISYYRNQS